MMAKKNGHTKRHGGSGNGLADRLRAALDVGMTPAEEEAQLVNFALGNAHFENEFITRDMIEAAVAKLKSTK